VQVREVLVAYDEQLAERIRPLLPPEGIREQKMFGGLAFMLNDHMAVGITGENLMLRLGVDGAEKAVTRKHVHQMEMSPGRPMTGMVYVEPDGVKGAALKRWVDIAVEYARSLPPKPPRKPSKSRR
jgi:hypothetical protein